MKQKRIMIAGPQGSGKSTLAAYFEGEGPSIRRTQEPLYGKKTLEVPSAYLENTWMYSHLIALAQDAWCILLMLDGTRSGDELYSPEFAKAFRVPIVGVVSKCAGSADAFAEIFARIGVAPPYFAVDITKPESLEQLKTYLDTLKGGKGDT